MNSLPENRLGGKTDFAKNETFLQGGSAQDADAECVTWNEEIALLFARAGHRVFPCGHDKKPLTPHGLKDATCDPDEVSRMWRWARKDRGVPDALPGLALKDHVVIDVDGGPDGFARFVEYADRIGARIDHAPLCETPSDGAHIVFRQPPDEPLSNSRGNLPSKLELPTDVRGVGGYVIAPGSFRRDGVDRFYNPVTPNGGALAVLNGAPPLPDAFVGIIRRELDADGKPIALTPAPADDATPVEAEGRPRGRADERGAERQHAWATRALRDECKIVEFAAKGGRNEALNRAAFTVGGHVGAGFLGEGEARKALLAAAQSCGLPTSEALKTINSGLLAGKAKPFDYSRIAAKEAAMAAQGEAQARALMRTSEGDLVDAETGEIVDEVAAAAIDPWLAPDMSLLRETTVEPAPAFDTVWLGPEIGDWARRAARAACGPVDYTAVSLLALVGGILANVVVRSRARAGSSPRFCGRRSSAIQVRPSRRRSRRR